jgi:hypothetical protein
MLSPLSRFEAWPKSLADWEPVQELGGIAPPDSQTGYQGLFTSFQEQQRLCRLWPRGISQLSSPVF